jgi:hypothetical protein
MQVNGPAAEGDGVGVLAAFDEVALGEHVRSLEATALAFAGDEANPFEGDVGGVGEVAGVVDVVPDAIGHFPQLVLDELGLVDRIEPPAPFDPPEVTAVRFGVEASEARDAVGDVLQCERRRHERDGMAGILRVEVNRMPQ